MGSNEPANRGAFVPQRGRDASEERRRLLRLIARADDEQVAAELRELDSELFDVVEDAPTEWRD